MSKDNTQPDAIDNITILKNKIKELESDKAELIEFLENIQEYDAEMVVYMAKEFVNKFREK